MIGTPKLNHEEVELLYQNAFDIPRSSLEQILALSRNSLIEDLKEVLEEAIRNFEDYEKAYEENSREPIFLAPAHAIFLLGELGAIETLPTINNFFRQKEEIIDFWLGDLLTEELWQAL